MTKYRVSKDTTKEQLESYGFVPDTIDENSKKYKYCLYRRLTTDSHVLITIDKNGHRLKYSNPDGSKIYLGKELNMVCSIRGLERKRNLETPLILERFNEEMDDLVQSGILVKKLEHKRKSK
jgi:hypothetical protein